jgi:cytochrome b
MEVIVKERTEDHMSHDAISAGVTMWEVLQGDVLVGVYHRESDAIAYKSLLESGALSHLDHVTSPQK